MTGIGPWGTDSYTYNTTGDRTSKTVAGLATTYTYTKGRLTSATGGEAGTYSYNANGSMTGLTQGGTAYTLTYDWMDNTTSYKAGAVTLASFTYDGDGTRVTKTGNGTTTIYTDKEGKTITETDVSGNLIADYVYVNGKLAAKKEPTALFFYHTDPAGTPLALTNSAGAIAWKADYKPFGEELITAATKENYKMFVGKEKDKETGLYYFGARYLQDKTARFISVDPVGPVDERSGKANSVILSNPQRLNRYSYAINNPYRYIDPDGRDAILVKYIGYRVNTGLGFKLPLGHSAVIAVNPDTGTTKYYEYGRYGDDFGKVRNKPVPDLVMKDGEPTEKSLKNLYKNISEHYGQNKPVDATYDKDADFQKTIDFATDRMNDKNRKPYSLHNNNCKTFAKDAVEAGRKEE